MVLAALREDKTQSQLASEFGIHPLQITQWKQVAVESLPQIFGAQRGRTAAEQADLERVLYERIGRLETELGWFKKKWDLSREERRELIGSGCGLSIRRQCDLMRPRKANRRPNLPTRPRDSSAPPHRGRRVLNRSLVFLQRAHGESSLATGGTDTRRGAS